MNRCLAPVPRGDVAVIANEHDEEGVDGELLADRVRALVEITGEALCCATRGPTAAQHDVKDVSDFEDVVRKACSAVPAVARGADRGM